MKAFIPSILPNIQAIRKQTGAWIIDMKRGKDSCTCRRGRTATIKI